MMETGFAERFATDWIAAWNSHDLERILTHYEDDFEMSSPIIVALAGEASGKLRGKDAVGAYWANALQKVPDLHFELVAALAGVDSVTVFYKGHRGLCAEVLHFGPAGKVRAAFAHYTRGGAVVLPMDSATAYEARAREFLRGRDRSPIGAQVVADWARTLRSGASVLEVGCGGGYPVTTALAAAGLQLWAIDSSPTLAAEFQSRFPSIPIQCARVQDSDFFGREFDGVVASGLLFLLPETDQASLISRIAKALVPGGRFLFTAPTQIATWKDMNTGLECTSLGLDRYETLLRKAGLRVVGTHVDEGDNNYYDAQKSI
jgi:SAM-dependent methyltransferase